METKKLSYTPASNVCSKLIEIEVKEGLVGTVNFTGGCHGNLQGISSLIKEMKIEDAIKRLEGIDCKGRGTSCPDQLAKALSQLL